MSDVSITVSPSTFREIGKNAESSSRAYAIVSQVNHENDKVRAKLEEKEKLHNEYKETKLKLARLEKELAKLNNPEPEPTKPESKTPEYGDDRVFLHEGKWLN